MNFRLHEIILTIESIKNSDKVTIEMICQILIDKVSALDPFLIGEQATLEETDQHPLADKVDVELILKELQDIKLMLVQPQQKLVNIKRGFVVIVKDEKTQVLLLGPEMRNYDLNIPEDQLLNEKFIGQVVFEAVQKELLALKDNDPEFAEKVKDAQINIQIIPIPEGANEIQQIQDQSS